MANITKSLIVFNDSTATITHTQIVMAKVRNMICIDPTDEAQLWKTCVIASIVLGGFRLVMFVGGPLARAHQPNPRAYLMANVGAKLIGIAFTAYRFYCRDGTAQ